MVEINKNELKEILSVLCLYGIDIKNIKIVRDTVGFVNKIYFVTAGKKKIVLRKSNPVTSLAHIKLEVKLLEYLSVHKFAATPQIIRNLKGKNIIIYNKCFFTLQNFMPGSVKASWNNLTGFTPRRVEYFFQTMASFSKAVEKFIYSNSVENKPLGYFVKNGPALLNRLYKRLPASAGKKLVLKNYQNILNFIVYSQKEFERTDYNSLPKQLVHFDFHPGNVNFFGNKVVSIFDFDWARYDARFSDLASAILQSCYYYGGKMGGKLRKDCINQAISNYQKVYGKSSFSKNKEKEYIKMAARGYAIYIFFWAVDLYEKNPSKGNFLVLDHFLKVSLINDYDILFS